MTATASCTFCPTNPLAFAGETVTERTAGSTVTVAVARLVVSVANIIVMVAVPTLAPTTTPVGPTATIVALLERHVTAGFVFPLTVTRPLKARDSPMRMPTFPG